MRVLVCGQCACVRITENYIQCERVRERSFFCISVVSGSSVVLVPVLDGASRGDDNDDDDGEKEGAVGDDHEGTGQRSLRRAITNTARRPPCVVAECKCL